MICHMMVNGCRTLRPISTYLHSQFYLSSLKYSSMLNCKAKWITYNVMHAGRLLQLSSFQHHHILQIRPISITSVFFKKKKIKDVEEVQIQEEESQNDDNVLYDPVFDNMRNDLDILGFIGSQANNRFDLGVLVLQPWIKWGPHMKKMTTPQMMLDEAVNLIATLPGVRVIKKEVVPVHDMQSKLIFGSGTMERLVSLVQSTPGITSVFISKNILKSAQREELEKAFGLRVMDRYSVVLGIFRHHALTKESKLQVALAELPFVKRRLGLKGEKEKMMILEREKRLRNALNTISRKRALIRQKRSKIDIPTVAVVGYTNAGKTSLIHAMTGDTRAEGKDQLFATLDVTAHGGKLPCGLEVLFIDTVGFIQEIPTDLIASFKATLEDALCADVIVHISDASHPDYDLQGKIVQETLLSLSLPKGTPIITVANKIDLGAAKSKEELDSMHLVSSVTGQGLEDLMADLETKILQVTGRQFWKFKLPTGSEEIGWLRKATGLVFEEINYDNPDVTTVITVMTDQELAAYKRNFRKR